MALLLTVLGAAPPPSLHGVPPAVQLHPEGAAQRGGGLGVGHLHHVHVAVGGAEVAAVQRGYLGLGLLEGGPRPVPKHTGKLEQEEEEEAKEKESKSRKREEQEEREKMEKKRRRSRRRGRRWRKRRRRIRRRRR